MSKGSRHFCPVKHYKPIYAPVQSNLDPVKLFNNCYKECSEEAQKELDAILADIEARVKEARKARGEDKPMWGQNASKELLVALMMNEVI